MIRTLTLPTVMLRTLTLPLFAIATAGCCLPEKEAIKPLPENVQMTFDDLLARVRLQVNAAIEAFYIDDWQQLETAAESIEQSARFLPRSTLQPATVKELLTDTAAMMQQGASSLKTAARTKNVEGANSALQRLTLQVRLLRK